MFYFYGWCKQFQVQQKDNCILTTSRAQQNRKNSLQILQYHCHSGDRTLLPGTAATPAAAQAKCLWGLWDSPLCCILELCSPRPRARGASHLSQSPSTHGWACPSHTAVTMCPCVWATSPITDTKLRACEFRRVAFQDCLLKLWMSASCSTFLEQGIGATFTGLSKVAVTSGHQNF